MGGSGGLGGSEGLGGLGDRVGEQYWKEIGDSGLGIWDRGLGIGDVGFGDIIRL